MVHFRLDFDSPVQFYRQIVDQVLAGVGASALAAGERLPGIRELAGQLGINPNTVAKAYTQLQLLGVVDSRQGSGVYVKPPPRHLSFSAARRKAIETLCRDFVGRAQLKSISLQELIDYLVEMKQELHRPATAPPPPGTPSPADRSP